MPGPTVQFQSVGAQLTTPPATGLPSPLLGSNPIGAPVAAGLGASPATYTNATNQIQLLYINAGASATTTLTKNGQVIASAVTVAASGASLVAIVAPGQSIIVTFSAALTSQFVDTP